MQRRSANSCGISNYSCKKIPNLTQVLSQLQLMTVSRLRGEHQTNTQLEKHKPIFLQHVQQLINNILQKKPIKQSGVVGDIYTNNLLSVFYYDKPQDQIEGQYNKSIPVNIISLGTLKTSYSNFLNMPRIVQGITYKQDVADLSTLTTKFSQGLCSDNLNILSNKSLKADSSYSTSFTDLFQSVMNWYTTQVDSESIDLTSKTVIQLILTNQNYLQSYDLQSADASKKQYYIHRVHKPGVLVPVMQPQHTDLNTVSFTTSPVYTVGPSITTGVSQSINKALQDWKGCQGPGVFFRTAMGSQPQFICLSQCL